MKRAVLTILGLIVLLIGLGSVAVGTGLVVTVGSDGVVNNDVGRVSGAGYALVMNDFNVDTPASPDTVSKFAQLTATARSIDGEDLFIGVAPPTDVAKYLAGVERDIVSDLSGGRATVVPVPGSIVPQPPGSQTFWTAKAIGTKPTINLSPTGAQTVVVMNATPTKPVNVDLQVGVKSEVLFPFGIGLIIFGVILVLLAIWIFVRAKKSRRRQLPPGAYPVAATQAVPYGGRLGYGEPQPVTQPVAPPPTAGGDGPPPASPPPAPPPASPPQSAG